MVLRRLDRALTGLLLFTAVSGVLLIATLMMIASARSSLHDVERIQKFLSSDTAQGNLLIVDSQEIREFTAPAVLADGTLEAEHRWQVAPFGRSPSPDPRLAGFCIPP